jgi:plastocyanin
MASMLVAVAIGPLAVLSRAPRAAAAASQVVAADQRFSPAHLEIAVGDTVTWVAGDDGHTVTSRDGTFDSSARGLMSDGDEFRFRFRMPGTFSYFCRVHQSKGMQGDVVVIDPYAPTTTTTRITPVTAAATTSSTTDTTASTLPTTTTTRVLATSSTTTLAMATSTTLSGAPAAPGQPVALNPDAPVVGSPAPGAPLTGSQAAARRAGGSDSTGPVAAAVGLALLAVLGGSGLFVRSRRRRPPA